MDRRKEGFHWRFVGKYIIKDWNTGPRRKGSFLAGKKKCFITAINHQVRDMSKRRFQRHVTFAEPSRSWSCAQNKLCADGQWEPASVICCQAADCGHWGKNWPTQKLCPRRTEATRAKTRNILGSYDSLPFFYTGWPISKMYCISYNIKIRITFPKSNESSTQI